MGMSKRKFGRLKVRLLLSFRIYLLNNFAFIMPSNPAWVDQLKPSGVSGSDLLLQERNRSSLSIDQLTEFIYGKETLERRQRILQVLEAEPVFDKSQNVFTGRVQRYERALARAKQLRRLAVKHGWKLEERRVAAELVSEPTSYALHDGMFLKTLEEQGTPEQHKLYLEPALRYEAIGCYAQTELGHGSNVRGLETTATWNQQDKTFTINSPYLTASKWWIGTLGRTANHAVVMAQLILDGKAIGPHPFVVHIRDLKTHEPLEGVHVGDIGPKFGYNTMDNGFLLFRNVKVPHSSMLARFSRVDPQTGKYIRTTPPALVYGTLTFIRCTIVMMAGATLARGVTVAVRYGAIRRQFTDRDASDPEKEETPVLNYTMVQYRLLPLLAATFGLHFTGKAMMELYQENQARMQSDGSKGSDLLPDLHATSCGLKALASYTAAEGLEVCRRACGGHGYSSFAGVGQWYADYLPTTTWEGDNYMLTQQVANYLLKCARAVIAGTSASDNDTTRILNHYYSQHSTGLKTPSFDVLGNDEDLVQAFAWRAAHLTFKAQHQRDNEKRAWNDLLVDFYHLSTAHSQYLVVKNFHATLASSIKSATLASDTLTVLRSCFRLYALHTLSQHASEFLLCGAVTTSTFEKAKDMELVLLKDVRPHAVRLVDSWAISDFQLESSLGRYDGKVYEDMFARASQLNPLNDVVVDPYPANDTLIRTIKGRHIDSKLEGNRFTSKL